MKKRIVSPLLALSVLVAAPSWAFDLNKMVPKAAPASTDKVDIDSLSHRGKKLILSVAAASGAFSEASIDMLHAVGKKAEAEKLKALHEEVKKKPDDQEQIKKLMVATNEAIDQLEQVDLNSNKELKGSLDKLLNAALNFGGGILLDTKAVGDAGALVKESEQMINLVKSNPLQYGMSALTTVNSLLGSGRFITDNVPNQVKNVQGFSAKLLDYFKTNKIQPPSAAKLQELANQLTPE